VVVRLLLAKEWLEITAWWGFLYLPSLVLAQSLVGEAASDEAVCQFPQLVAPDFIEGDVVLLAVV
jgi:hypothetical protein